MPDVYNTIAEAAPDMVEQVADVLEVRAGDAKQKDMLASYLSEIEFPSEARVVEIGCGTGPVSSPRI